MVLEHNPENYGKILELSSELAAFDKNSVRFSVDAGVIDRLGKELVARHETAVSELVKNAYDADATYVELIFIDANAPNGTLTIEDDGHGMTKEQLINGFMKISSPDKIDNPVSPLYKRKRAGKKGIGRFATQRLSNTLTIITQTEGSPNALEVHIDWNQFNNNKNLIVISNPIVEVPKKREKGTTLILSGLRESWNVTALKRVYRYSIEVIQPFPISKVEEAPKESTKIVVDPGFGVRCWQSISGGLEDVADDETMILEHALAEISGEVDSSGKARWTVDSAKLGFHDSDTIGKSDTDKEPFENLKNVRFKAYYFIYNIGMIPKMVTGYIQQKANDSGGFRLYRNGFRVLPYGEPQNDWLGLDESVRRRVILPSHGNNNFFGYVEITDPNDDTFNELSSREGLFKNQVFDDLVDFVYRSILASVSRIASFRKKKQTTGQKDWVKEEKTPSEEVNDLADELDTIADEIDSDDPDQEEPQKNSSGNAGEDNQQTNEETTGQGNRSKRFREFAKKLRSAATSIEEIGMLRVLAGLGLTIGEFTHEIKQYLPAFDVDSDFLINNTEEGSDLNLRAIRLKESFSSFNTYASYFDETISRNVQRQLMIVELRDVINAFLTVIIPDTVRSALDVSHQFIEPDLFSCKMHPSEWASILFNLYSNSKKAIKRARVEGKIFIKASKTEKSVFMEFSDNGDGIPSENEDKIFDAFFTTSNQTGHAANARQELNGTGLGLKIISDIILSYGGEISLTPSPVGFSTTFRIEIPMASEEEISEYDI